MTKHEVPTFLATGTGLAFFFGITVAWLTDIAVTPVLLARTDVKITTVVLLGVGCFCTLLAQQFMVMGYRKYCRAYEDRQTPAPRFPMPGQTRLPAAHEIPPATHRMP